MPRGGARPGAGRKPGSGAKKVAPLVRAFAPDGQKAADAPAAWPFGTVAPAPSTAVEALPPVAPAEPLTALQLFQQIYRDDREDMRTRLGAAAQALPFEAARPAAVGKKEAKNEAAKKTASRFAPSAPPKLVAALGKKV